MKEQLYKKVFIRNEADLPKEEGQYFVEHQGRHEYYHFCSRGDFDNKHYWIKYIDWYLQPIEPINRERVIEIIERVLFEYGWIQRPHCDETDNLLVDIASELCPDAGEKEPVNNDKAIIQKQDELIKHLKSYDWLCELDQLKEWLSKKHQIEQELQALKAE